LIKRATWRGGRTKVCPYTFWLTDLPSIEDSGGAVGDYGKARLAHGSAGKIKVGPGEPGVDPLVLRKRRVRAFDGSPRSIIS